MKKICISVALASTVLFSSCIGSFSAFNKLKDWNLGVTSSKFGNELIFIALWVVPVYQIASLGDLLIFNSIEFWGGTNPIAMTPGDEEIQVVKAKGSVYEIKATPNRFDVVVVDGKKQGETATLIYLPEDQSWNKLNKDQSLTKLASLKDGLLMAHLPNKTVALDTYLSRSAMASILTKEANAFDIKTVEVE